MYLHVPSTLNLIISSKYLNRAQLSSTVRCGDRLGSIYHKNCIVHVKCIMHVYMYDTKSNLPASLSFIFTYGDNLKGPGPLGKGAVKLTLLQLQYYNTKKHKEFLPTLSSSTD